MIFVKERTDSLFVNSSSWVTGAMEIGKEVQQARERVKTMTPEAPDGSGQTGSYHAKLSHYLGRPVYRTPGNLIFFHFGDKSNVVPEKSIEEARLYFIESEGIDILG